jgi:hypothetical protein
MNATPDPIITPELTDLHRGTSAVLHLPKNSPRVTPPSLRPPTLMIDLLFGALMLFAFQMGDPNSVTVIPKDFDIPTSNEKASKKNQNLLPLRPVKSGKSGWVYELPDGRRLTAEAVVKTIKSKSKTPVLLVPSNARVQSYIEAEQPLRRLGVKAGLAVATNKGAKK